jgi:hypothetical protein
VRHEARKATARSIRRRPNAETVFILFLQQDPASCLGPNYFSTTRTMNVPALAAGPPALGLSFAVTRSIFIDA